MKLASHIERQFNKILFISILSGAMSVLVFSYFSAKNDCENAVEFIVAHVRAVSESQVNAQNVSEIDKDVNLVYAAWKKTQNLDFRIRVFLDETLVAHAGQLALFSGPSKGIAKYETLPSGQKLRIEVQASLLNTMLIALVGLLTISGFLFLLLGFLKKNITRTVKEITMPLEMRVRWLNSASATLQESIKGGYNVATSDITEMKDLDRSLECLFGQVLTYEKDLAKKSFDDGRIRIVNTVVHNLKNLIVVFEHRLKRAESLSDVDKCKFEDVLAQIQDLSSKILLTNKPIDSLSINEKFNLVKSVRRVVSQKKETLNYNDQKSLSLNIETSHLAEIIIDGPRAEFEAALNNIITNSFEATVGSDHVVVSVSVEKGIATVSVIDTGKGIPENILPLLASEGKTFSKPGGSGLGLFHARSTIEGQMHGRLIIDSKEMKGTTVTLTIPLSAKEAVSPFAVRIFPGMNLVLVDDDPLIHNTFKNILNETISNIKISSIFSESELSQWFKQNGPGEIGSRFYLFDYNLKSETTNGLKLIEKYGLALESLLVTGDADRPEIQIEAKKLGVKVVSKDEIEKIKFMPLETHELQDAGLM
ncbi:MAG: sensor histidine kinase [Bdellovibrionota bacterium]